MLFRVFKSSYFRRDAEHEPSIGLRSLNAIASNAMFNRNNFGGNADRAFTCRHILQDNRIRPYAGMIADSNGAQNFCACANIDMSTNYRWFMPCPVADCHLLKEQTIGSDYRVRMDYNPIGMRQQQTTAKSAI